MLHKPLCLAALAFVITASASASPRLPMNRPVTVQGIRTVCTGIGENRQSDPRWSAYPLKIVFAGKAGQWVTDADVAITTKHKPILDVHCGGPWLLVKLPPGRYRIVGRMEGQRYAEKAFAPRTGQGRVILRFPKSGGVTSIEHGARLRALSENRITQLKSHGHQ